MAGKITLLRLQREGTTTHYTQGAATLYPGLYTSALTARQLPTLTSELGYSFFAHQIGHPNKNRSRQQDFILLPTSVGMTGLEPATSRPPDACANQLRYIPQPAFIGLAVAKLLTYYETSKHLQMFFVNMM